MRALVILGASLWSLAIATAVLGAILRWNHDWVAPIVVTGFLGGLLLGVGWTL